jgi:hypothetical protein
VNAERLPGWESCLAGDPKIESWIADLSVRIENAIRDEDAVRFEKELSSVSKAWWRVNQIVAEAYRKENLDPELWELRYIKWMRITFIKFDSPMGEFYLVPRTPSRKPKAEHWYTVDEMLDMLHPNVVRVIEIAGKLPVRPDSLPGPKRGEYHLHIDATGPTVKTYTVDHKGARYG